MSQISKRSRWLAGAVGAAALTGGLILLPSVSLAQAAAGLAVTKVCDNGGVVNEGEIINCDVSFEFISDGFEFTRVTVDSTLVPPPFGVDSGQVDIIPFPSGAICTVTDEDFFVTAPVNQAGTPAIEDNAVCSGAACDPVSGTGCSMPCLVCESLAGDTDPVTGLTCPGVEGRGEVHIRHENVEDCRVETCPDPATFIDLASVQGISATVTGGAIVDDQETQGSGTDTLMCEAGSCPFVEVEKNCADPDECPGIGTIVVAVTNTGDGPATNCMLSDDTYDLTGTDCDAVFDLAENGGSFGCSFPVLLSQTTTDEITVTCDDAPLICVEDDGDGVFEEGEFRIEDSDLATCMCEPGCPFVEVEKNCDDPETCPGIGTIVVAVTNTGDGPAANCMLSDDTYDLTGTDCDAVFDLAASGGSFGCSFPVDLDVTTTDEITVTCSDAPPICVEDDGDGVFEDGEFRIEDSDLATCVCVTCPFVEVEKNCVDPDTCPGTGTIVVAVTNTGNGPAANCTLSDDTYALTGTDCDAVFDLEANDGSFECNFPVGLDVTTTDEITVACSNAPPLCVEDDGDGVFENGEFRIDDSDQAVCTCQGEGCLTKTPGFWCSRPRATDFLLPLEVCGIALDNVDAATQGSAIEDLVFGRDHRIDDPRRGRNPIPGVDPASLGYPNGIEPQNLQLVRQCTAATLNLAASLEAAGNCDSEKPGISQTVENCCAHALCTGTARAISDSGCIETLDAFNNAYFGGIDRRTPESFPTSRGTGMAGYFPPGRSDSSTCREANGNGFINSR